MSFIIYYKTFNINFSIISFFLKTFCLIDQWNHKEKF